jgi:transposase-like protein
MDNGAVTRITGSSTSTRIRDLSCYSGELELEVPQRRMALFASHQVEVRYPRTFITVTEKALMASMYPRVEGPGLLPANG